MFRYCKQINYSWTCYMFSFFL